MNKLVYSILYAITVAMIVFIVLFFCLVVVLYLSNFDNVISAALEISSLVGLGFFGGMLADEFIE